MKKETTFKCVMCGSEGRGYGHNPAPVADVGRCCDGCNIQVVSVRAGRAAQALPKQLAELQNHILTQHEKK